MALQKLTRWGLQINYLYCIAKLRQVRKSRYNGYNKQANSNDCREIPDVKAEVTSMAPKKILGNQQ